MPAQCGTLTIYVTAVAALEKVQKLALKICTKNWAHNSYITSISKLTLAIASDMGLGMPFSTYYIGFRS